MSAIKPYQPLAWASTFCLLASAGLLSLFPNDVYATYGFFVASTLWTGISLQNFFSDSKFGFIQGNFNENHLLLDSKKLSNELNKYSDYLMSFENLNGWVCGLGHGINKNTPENNVHLFIETIRKKFS